MLPSFPYRESHVKLHGWWEESSLSFHLSITDFKATHLLFIPMPPPMNQIIRNLCGCACVCRIVDYVMGNGGREGTLAWQSRWGAVSEAENFSDPILPSAVFCQEWALWGHGLPSTNRSWGNSLWSVICSGNGFQGTGVGTRESEWGRRVYRLRVCSWVGRGCEKLELCLIALQPLGEPMQNILRDCLAMDRGRCIAHQGLTPEY